MLTGLRKTLTGLERVIGLNSEAGGLPLGIATIDAALGGGLARGALHEIAAFSESHIAAVSGFALALAAPKKNRSAIWVAQDMARIESGALCGAGLDSFALAPERLITVAVTKNRDLLWTMEEALRCRAVGVVIGELRGESIEPVALRRLSLAASAGGALAMLLRGAPQGDASTAATRWIVEAAPSLPRYGHGPGPPRLRAQLVRNRRGPLGNWMLEWSDIDERLVLASTHPQPVAQPAADRPARATVA